MFRKVLPALVATMVALFVLAMGLVGAIIVFNWVQSWASFWVSLGLIVALAVLGVASYVASAVLGDRTGTALCVGLVLLGIVVWSIWKPLEGISFAWPELGKSGVLLVVMCVATLVVYASMKWYSKVVNASTSTTSS